MKASQKSAVHPLPCPTQPCLLYSLHHMAGHEKPAAVGRWQRPSGLTRICSVSGWTMFLERCIIGRIEGDVAFYFGASQGATSLADAVRARRLTLHADDKWGGSAVCNLGAHRVAASSAATQCVNGERCLCMQLPPAKTSSKVGACHQPPELFPQPNHAALLHAIHHRCSPLARTTRTRGWCRTCRGVTTLTTRSAGYPTVRDSTCLWECSGQAAC